ncbi:27600_t:CDS:2 [Gigaspora margarita]|uniref:27600_t:CDS:1 n=1 Tax=Gigaspora margarita TaxID=4874 RepID=A0ABN7VJ04_GIGMA|nr:27600_t:CDS:2 [Gigaspora margarita]
MVKKGYPGQKDGRRLKLKIPLYMTLYVTLTFPTQDATGVVGYD